ncbi:hypothetical protein [Pseudonocardia sp. H11422]|uniref:hypothetical protein n=1 Tax=Pseudonocardia sp. H11422 TaxID=2835866 RepID=UPI001BDDC2EE|nr:hypothetical protein [Pseudonocardia sp. H11422]
MTAAAEDGPALDLDALTGLARWLGGLAAELRDLASEVGRLARQVELDWPDARGREWSERAGLVDRELVRQAEVGAGLAGTVGRVLERTEDPVPSAGLPADDGTGSRASGPLLGDTSASRAADERGMRIATLPDPDRPAPPPR